MDEEKKPSKRIIWLLVLACAATVFFAVLYSRQLSVNNTLRETSVSPSEIASLQEDYQAALQKEQGYEAAEQERDNATNGIIGFINAFFIDPDSESDLLSGCSKYFDTDSDAWKQLQGYASGMQYGTDSREIRNLRIASIPSEDGSGYSTFAVFEISGSNGKQSVSQYHMLSVKVKLEGTDCRITQIKTFVPISIDADGE